MPARITGALPWRAWACFCVLGTIAACGGGGGDESAAIDADAPVASTPAPHPSDDASSGGGGSGSGGASGGMQSVTLNWRPPTRNTNGTLLTNLAGYRIYSGTARTQMKRRTTLRNPGLSSFVVEPLAQGEVFFAISAINRQGVESPMSRIVRVYPE